MIDTGDTLALATNTLHENGARAIFVLVSHCTMQPNSASLKKLSQLPIARLVVTNSLPQTHLMEEVNEETRDTITDSTPVDSPVTTSSKLDSGSSAGSTNGSTSGGGKPPNGVSPTMGGKLTVLDISPLLAESIRRTHNGESISTLFGGWAERAGMTGTI